MEQNIFFFYYVTLCVTEHTSVHCNDLHGVSAVLFSVQGLHGL